MLSWARESLQSDWAAIQAKSPVQLGNIKPLDQRPMRSNLFRQCWPRIWLDRRMATLAGGVSRK